MSGVQPVVAEGVEIPPDTWVLFAIAGANRDPAVYPDPDRFDVARAPKEALTFGRGVKSCPGMHLARKNMIVALQVLVERMPDLELVDAERALPRRTVLRCPDAIRVRPTRRRGRGDS
jgi:cytochrome P450